MIKNLGTKITKNTGTKITKIREQKNFKTGNKNLGTKITKIGNTNYINPGTNFLKI
jgi:hypothetical protein